MHKKTSIVLMREFVERMPVERIKEVIAYDPLSGIFTWKQRLSKNVPIGAEAGSIKSRGYLYIRIDKKDYTAQRIAWVIMTDSAPNGVIQFKDEDSTNLKWDNLLLCETITGFDHNNAADRSAYRKVRQVASYDKYRNSHLKKMFKFSLREYEALLVSQGGKCAICEQHETFKRKGKEVAMSVDHCHVTGDIRGLLCNNCNNGLGQFKDNLEYIMKAYNYILKHKSKKSDSNVIPMKTGA